MVGNWNKHISILLILILPGSALLPGCRSKDQGLTPTNTLSPYSLTDTIHINPDQDASENWNMNIELIKLEMTLIVY